MNRTVIRNLSLLLCLVMLFTLAACGKAGKADAAVQPAVTEEKEEEIISGIAYKSEFVPLQAENMWGLTPVLYTDDGFYATASVTLGKKEIPYGQVEEYEGQYDIYGTMLYFVGNDGKISELPNFRPDAPAQDTMNRKEYWSYCTFGRPVSDSQGRLLVLESFEEGWYAGPDSVYGTDAQYETGNYRSETHGVLRVLDREGTELSRASLNYDFGDAYLNIGNAVPGLDGTLLVPADQQVFCISETGSVLWTVPSDTYISRLTTLSNGSVIAMLYEDSGTVLRRLDLNTHTFGEPIGIPDGAWNLIPGTEGYDLYFSAGMNFYGFRLGQEPVQILNWVDCDINGQTLDSSVLSVGEDGSVRGIVSDYADGKNITRLFTLLRVSADSLPKKQILTLAQMDYYPDYQLINRVIAFNLSHSNVRITLKDYSIYSIVDTPDAALDQLLSDLRAGKGPDLIPVSELPYRQLAYSGLLENLYPFLDADSELSREDFFPNVLSSLECDGGLYQAVTGFMVDTVSGLSEVVGNTPGWTYDDFYSAYSAMPAGCTVMDPYSLRDSVLQKLLGNSLDRFIDWKNKECDFETDEFKQLLSFVSLFPADYNWDEYQPATAELIRQHRQMLTQTYVYSPDALLWNAEYYGGLDSTCIGWPSSEGVGSALQLEAGFAMSSRCADKNAAWDFLRGFLTESGQQEVGTIPTNRKVFDARVRDLMTVEYRKDANGNTMFDAAGNAIQQGRVTWYDEDGNEQNIYAMSQRQADKLLEVIQTCTHAAEYDTTVFDIVTAQSQAYFNGSRSADDVARLIQTKVSLYLSELS